MKKNVLLFLFISFFSSFVYGQYPRQTEPKDFSFNSVEYPTRHRAYQEDKEDFMEVFLPIAFYTVGDPSSVLVENGENYDLVTLTGGKERRFMKQEKKRVYENTKVLNFAYRDYFDNTLYKDINWAGYFIAKRIGVLWQMMQTAPLKIPEFSNGWTSSKKKWELTLLQKTLESQYKAVKDELNFREAENAKKFKKFHNTNFFKGNPISLKDSLLQYDNYDCRLLIIANRDDEMESLGYDGLYAEDSFERKGQEIANHALGAILFLERFKKENKSDLSTEEVARLITVLSDLEENTAKWLETVESEQMDVSIPFFIEQRAYKILRDAFVNEDFRYDILSHQQDMQITQLLNNYNNFKNSKTW